jgi:DNA-directed RNA polymerase II subunit RPB2
MAEVVYDSYMADNLGGVGAGAGGAASSYIDEYQGTYGDALSQPNAGGAYMDGDDEDDDDAGEITQAGCWDIINSFFDENGLVQQQLSSFDEFVKNTIQELVEENKSLTLEQSDQHTGLEGDISRRYEIEFGQIYLAKPSMTESDGQAKALKPQEARLRNLTYASPLYLDIKQRRLIESDEIDPMTGDKQWVDEDDNNVVEEQQVFIGKVSTLAALVALQ